MNDPRQPFSSEEQQIFQQQPNYDRNNPYPPPQSQGADHAGNKATTGLILGILAVIGSIFPLLGLILTIPCSIIGIILSSQARRRLPKPYEVQPDVALSPFNAHNISHIARQRTAALVGLILSIAALLLGLLLSSPFLAGFLLVLIHLRR